MRGLEPLSRTPSPQPSPLRGEGVRISEPESNASTLRPLTVLIAALGGEGGGVLTDWIVAAAASQNFPVQSTSIPGVAQRTGATTYHIEMVPAPAPTLPSPASGGGLGGGAVRSLALRPASAMSISSSPAN